MIKKILGPPGTVKTFTLLNHVKEYIKKGTPLHRIGYFAFTRKAAYEARDRFLKESPNLNKKDLKDKNIDIKTLSLNELDEIWNKNKKRYKINTIISNKY